MCVGLGENLLSSKILVYGTGYTFDKIRFVPFARIIGSSVNDHWCLHHFDTTFRK